MSRGFVKTIDDLSKGGRKSIFFDFFSKGEYDGRVNEISKNRILSLPYPLRLSWTESTLSTNDDLKEMAKAGEADFTVRIADSQTAGKGRKNRSFFSKGGLYMSILLPFGENFFLVTPIAAIAVAKAIRSLTGEDALIKWVNDVYVNGKKVCGILSESVVTEGGRRIVLGVGVNLATPQEGFPREIRDIAGSIDADRSELAARFLEEFFSRFCAGDATEIKKEYIALSFLVGKEVFIQKENGCLKATVLGFTEDLSLSVRYLDGRTEDLIAGDVSLRLDGVPR